MKTRQRVSSTSGVDRYFHKDIEEVSDELFLFLLWMGLWRERSCLPDVEQFQGVVQNPLLHVVIDLLIGSKTWSPIDLRRKKMWRFFFICIVLNFSISKWKHEHFRSLSRHIENSLCVALLSLASIDVVQSQEPQLALMFRTMEQWDACENVREKHPADFMRDADLPTI